MEIGGFGSEGLLGYVFVREVLIPMLRKVIIPWWGKHIMKKPNPSATQKLNPNSLTLAKVGQALKDHEKHDGERTKEIKETIEKIRETQSKHGERLAGLESRSQ